VREQDLEMILQALVTATIIQTHFSPGITASLESSLHGVTAPVIPFPPSAFSSSRQDYNSFVSSHLSNCTVLEGRHTDFCNKITSLFMSRSERCLCCYLYRTVEVEAKLAICYDLIINPVIG
jgi:hypothetical protein